jgi:phosphatidate phosphatase APP1
LRADLFAGALPRLLAGTAAVALILALWEPGIAIAQTSDFKASETVLFFPTAAQRSADGRAWNLNVHGVVFEPEEDSLKRAALMALVHRTVGREVSDVEWAVFNLRVRPFLVDNQRGRKVAIRLGDRVYPVGTSAANGHFTACIPLPADEADRLERSPDGWLEFTAVTRETDRRRLAGRVRLVEPAGLSIVSDIDDTIKLSNVRDRKALLANTFLRPFEPVPGMAKVYREFARAGAMFHYVSGSPWQLYTPLAEFLEKEGFPAGTFHLKDFRLHDSSGLKFLESQEKYKEPVIEGLFKAYPQRRFVLIGDTGEKDPEIYAALARDHAEQVVAIFLRNAGGEKPDSPRMLKAMERIERTRWKLFDRPEDLSGEVVRLVREHGRQTPPKR